MYSRITLELSLLLVFIIYLFLSAVPALAVEEVDPSMNQSLLIHLDFRFEASWEANVSGSMKFLL